jgi:hypothetical protein
VSGCFETQFGPVIAEHWRQNFPHETEKLRAAGALEREDDKLALKAAFDLCSLRKGGVPVETACEAIAILWRKPPKLSAPETRPPS